MHIYNDLSIAFVELKNDSSIMSMSVQKSSCSQLSSNFITTNSNVTIDKLPLLLGKVSRGRTLGEAIKLSRTHSSKLLLG